MNAADDLKLRQLLDDAAARKTAADYAIEGLRFIADHARRWADPDRPLRDPAEVLSTILAIAGDTAARVTAMRDEEQAGRR